METSTAYPTQRLHLVLLFAVLLAALALRLKGAWFGYPLALHPDEPAIVNNALRMLETGDLNPHFFNYPSLNIYLQALLSRATMIGSQLFLSQSATDIPQIRYYLVGRLFVVVQSVLTILVTYEIGLRLLSSLTGLVAAVFMAFAFLHVANSFILTVDSPSALWSVLATLMAVLIFTSGKRLPYYLAGGLFAGLAAGSKYTAVVSFAPILVAHLIMSSKDRRWLDWNVVAAMAAGGLTFLITTPYALLDFPAFIEAIRFESEHYRTGHTGAEAAGRTSFLSYGQYLIESGYGLVPVILSGLGVLWLLIKEPSKAILLLATPLLLFLFVGQYKVYFPRNVVILIPYLALFGGYFVASAYAWVHAQISGPERASPFWQARLILLIVLVLFAATYTQVAQSTEYVRRITLPDTRWESIVWLQENLPVGTTVGREHYTPPLEDFADEFAVTYLGYNAVAARPDEVAKFDYMIVSAGDYVRFVNSPDTYPLEAAAYEAFFEENELIREFVADGTTLNGPTIRVYRITRAAGED